MLCIKKKTTREVKTSQLCRKREIFKTRFFITIIFLFQSSNNIKRISWKLTFTSPFFVFFFSSSIYERSVARLSFIADNYFLPFPLILTQILFIATVLLFIYTYLTKKHHFFRTTYIELFNDVFKIHQVDFKIFFSISGFKYHTIQASWPFSEFGISISKQLLKNADI